MLEWLAILFMAALGLAAFAILFQTIPGDASEHGGETLKQNLAKLAKEEIKEKEEQKKKGEKTEKKPAEENTPKKNKKDEEKRKGKANKSPPRERKTIIEIEDEPEEEEEPRAIYVPNVPIQNNTPTTKVRGEMRSRSPIMPKEEKVKKEVLMPSKKQIEQDLQKGFVVVQKKGPPPLTEKQRKEREALRLKEEEEEKRREMEAIEREREKQKKRMEAVTSTDVSFEDVKAKIDKQKLERQTKEEERKRVNCVVKEYTKVTAEAEAETEKRSWGAAMLTEGDDMPSYDAEDYPSL